MPRSPRPSSTMPPAIGNQISTLKIGQSKDILIRPSIRSFEFFQCRLRSPEIPSKQCGESDDHGERIVIKMTGLHIAHDARNPTDRASRSVHDNAVDQTGIADLPQPLPQSDSPAGENFLIEVVGVVFVRKQLIEKAE